MMPRFICATWNTTSSAAMRTSQASASEKPPPMARSEEHTSELQSPCNLVCRLLLEEKHTSELQSRLHLVCRLLLEKKKKSEQMQYSGDQAIVRVTPRRKTAHLYSEHRHAMTTNAKS